MLQGTTSIGYSLLHRPQATVPVNPHPPPDASEIAATGLCSTKMPLNELIDESYAAYLQAEI